MVGPTHSETLKREFALLSKLESSRSLSFKRFDRLLFSMMILSLQSMGLLYEEGEM